MLPLILAGLGLAKGIADTVKEGKDRDVQAATTKWSPWTGMKAVAPQRADLLGNAMQGGLAGLMVNQMGGLGGATNAGNSSINLWDNVGNSQLPMQPSDVGSNLNFGSLINKRGF